MSNKTPQASTPETGCFVAGGASSNRGVTSQRGFVLPSPTLIMAGVIIGLSISNLLFFNLYRGVADEYSAFKSTVETQSEALRLDNERKLQELAEVNRQVEKQYLDGRRRLADLGRTVRVQANRCEGTMPTLSIPAQGTAGAGLKQPPRADIQLTVEQCEQVANDAVIDAMTLNALQQWVREVSEIK